MSSSLEKIIELVQSYERLGKKLYKNGAVAYGNAPHIGKKAYLHLVMPAATEKQISKIEQAINMTLHQSFRSLLSEHNGIDLFSGTLSIFGFKDWDKSADSQPFDIITPNTYERPAWLKSGSLEFAFYNFDGSKAVLSPAGQVTVHDAEKGKILNKWSSLDHFLASEAARLPSFFDDSGKLVDEDVCTVPIKD